jgi:GT2 family glycosyltransferase
LTRRDRTPKPALDAVSGAFRGLPVPVCPDPPSFSVIVCTHNGARTLEDCLAGVAQLDYPSFEVLVVNDGSTDGTAAIAARHEVRYIETEQRGLSCARNAGLALARGELVAFLDDDARPDPHWLTYLAHRFRTGGDVGVGGPNLPVLDDGPVAHGVANAPGGPTHVLVDDCHAEHIPGCNMAFVRAALEEVGGFDPQFRTAGDDVDLCWRLLERGWTLGFSPGAVVWHHRRNSVRGYFRQQRGYGRAEALLERKWPEKYSAAGHITWSGRMYGNGSAQHHGGGRWRVYYGAWGSAAFQSIYQPAAGGLLRVLPLMPEWYLLIATLAAIGAAGAAWRPLLLAIPLATVALATLVFDAALGAARARFPSRSGSAGRLLGLRLLTAWLYLIQPLARLYGRQAEGLTPWRRHGALRFSVPRPSEAAIWSEQWRSPEEWVRGVKQQLREEKAVVLSGGDWDRWDLQVRGGALGSARLRLGVEEHGSGQQLVRLRWWPCASVTAVVLGALAGSVAILAAISDAEVVAVGLGVVAASIVLRLIYECGAATVTIKRALRRPLDAGAQLEPSQASQLGVPEPAEGLEQVRLVTLAD